MVPGGPQLALCNPELMTAGDPLSGEEGCLSFPGMYFQVIRPEEAHLRYETTEGKPVEIKAQGLVARVLLHELDHLDGVLFIDGLSAARRVLLASRLKQIQRRQKQGETV